MTLQPSCAEIKKKKKHSCQGRNEVCGIRDQKGGIWEHSPGIRDQSPGIWEHSPGIRDHSPGIRDHSPGIRDYSPGIWDHSPGIRDHKPWDQDQEFLDGSGIYSQWIINYRTMKHPIKLLHGPYGGTSALRVVHINSPDHMALISTCVTASTAVTID